MSKKRTTCQNPFKKCTNTDIAVTIMYKGEMLPICSVCWKEIAESDKEWKEVKTHEETYLEEDQ